MKSKYPSSFKGITCDIIGMGISNIALAEYLHKEGAIITVRDKTPPPSATQKLLNDVSEHHIYGENYLSGISGEYIFRSPSVRPDVPAIASAISNGSTLGAEWELFFHRTPCKVFAVTGSDGKTTTVTLTREILARSQPQRQIYAAGNIGVPLISLLDKIATNDIVVAELSSFQLMTFDAVPTVSAITNITPNHLDYHRDMREYSEAKTNILSPETTKTVIHPEHIPREISDAIKLKSRNVISCGFSDIYSIYCSNTLIFDQNLPIINTQNIRLKGRHNLENYMTAIGICGNLATKAVINEVAEGFSGVAHRAQLIATKNGIKYYDSSIDSTPSRTATTLQFMTTPLTVICGGYDKGLTYELLADALNQKADNVIVTGASAPKILEELAKLPKRHFKYYHIEDFEEAVKKATEVTPAGGTVLLSPACASFDRFKNYEERGLFFQSLVKKNSD